MTLNPQYLVSHFVDEYGIKISWAPAEEISLNLPLVDFIEFLYMNNYTYYCIRESDFKEYVLRELKKHSNFHLLEEGILDISGSKKKGVLVTKDSKNFVAGSIFQSMITPESAKKENIIFNNIFNS